MGGWAASWGRGPEWERPLEPCLSACCHAKEQRLKLCHACCGMHAWRAARRAGAGASAAAAGSARCPDPRCPSPRPPFWLQRWAGRWRPEPLARRVASRSKGALAVGIHGAPLASKAGPPRGLLHPTSRQPQAASTEAPFCQPQHWGRYCIFAINIRGYAHHRCSLYQRIVHR